jgi:single-strand DNA-binding protein
MATTEKFQNAKKEWVDNTQWHLIVGYYDMSNRVAKGDLVAVEGKIEYRKYDDKDGKTKWVTEIVAYSVKRLKKKQTDDSYTQQDYKDDVEHQQSIAHKDEAELDFPENDLPF